MGLYVVFIRLQRSEIFRPRTSKAEFFRSRKLGRRRTFPEILLFEILRKRVPDFEDRPEATQVRDGCHEVGDEELDGEAKFRQVNF